MRVKIKPDKDLACILDKENKKKMQYTVKDRYILTVLGRAKIVEGSKVQKKLGRYKKGTFIRSNETCFLRVGHRWVWLLLILLLTVTICIICIVHSSNSLEIVKNSKIIQAGEGEVLDGSVETFTHINETDGSEFSFRVNVNPFINYATQKGNIIIENKKGNDYAMIAEIYLNGEREHIYVSPLIKPNKNIQTGKLAKKLKIGEYDAVCYLRIVTNDGKNELVGCEGVRMKIYIR